jgi:hypothetical protein
MPASGVLPYVSRCCAGLVSNILIPVAIVVAHKVFTLPCGAVSSIYRSLPALEYGEAKDRGSGEDPSPKHQTYAYPEQQLSRWGPEAESYERAYKRPRKHGRLKGHAYEPVTVPKTLYAFAAFGEEALAVEPALQLFSDYRHENCS